MRNRATALPVRQTLILDSPAAILALAPLLEDFAAKCGQSGAMHWLPYFLDPAATRRRAPRLVLLLQPEGERCERLRTEDLRGAALFYEYEVFGMKTGAVATGDAVGFSSVIGPWSERAEVAAEAARALVDRGAVVVLATYEGLSDQGAGIAFTGLPDVAFAQRQRRVARMLRLMPTLDETLAQMGKSTRANLRRYRRRLEAHTTCEFVAEAAKELAGMDFRAMNRGSLNPVAQQEFTRRVQAASELSGSFLCGLRSADGRWLALLGGWRQGRTTVLQWQMNSAGWEKFSLGTAARSYFIEQEIAHGAERLMLYGGTPHTMRSAFEAQAVADLVVRRKGVRSLALSLASRVFAGPNQMAARGNFLAATLQDKGLRWRSVRPKEKAERLPLLKSRRTETTA